MVEHHLYIQIASYLRAHPTTPETPLKLPIRGMPMPDEPPPPPAVPRGWKLSEILPLHSPAVTGGGISEDLLKDMMGQIGGAIPGGSAPGPNPNKKPKRKIIRA
jgi:signal recognition particle subunit SRP19